jgi:flagellar hook assembly protein FlgD
MYQRSVFFGGQVLDRTSGTSYLPQSIEGGNANPQSPTDGIQVVGTQAKLSVIENVRLSSPVVTPNNDGVNDKTTIGFDLFGVEDAPVSVEVYDLSGRRVAVVFNGPLGAGRYQPAWSGRDAAEAIVPPGVYVVRLQADVDEGSFTRVVPVSVAY